MEKLTLNELLNEGRLVLPRQLHSFSIDSSELKNHSYGGVYIFRGNDKQVLYIGITDNIFRRISSHISGYGSKDLYSYPKEYLTVEFFQEEDPLYRDIYESYLIHTLKPRYNISKTNRRKLEC